MAIKRNLTELGQIAFSAYNRVPAGGLAPEQLDDVLRERFNEVCEGDASNFYKFMANRYKVYAIMQETMVISVGELLTDKYDEFMEFKDTMLGDENLFETTDKSMFRVDAIADGNGAIRRQKLYGGQFSVPTANHGIKIYAELVRFLAGKIDWVVLSNRVMDSFANKIGVLGYNAMVGAKGSLPGDQTEDGGFVEATMDGLLERIMARSGSKPIIYGTSIALGKITQAEISENMKDQVNQMGHYGVYKGYELIQLPQGLNNSGELVADNNELFIIPSDDRKVVKVALEGEPIVYDKQAETNNSMQMEMFFGRKVGATAVVAKTWGIYTIS